MSVDFDNYEVSIHHEQPELYTIIHEVGHIDYLTNIALQKALENPGNLIGIYPQGKHLGHAIGITAKKVGDRYSLKYFDFNFREASFDDIKAAKKSITKLITFYTKLLNPSGYFTSDTFSSMLWLTNYHCVYKENELLNSRKLKRN